MLTARFPCGTGESRYRCFLPDLTGFTVPPCTGPNYQQSTSTRKETSPKPMLHEKQYPDHWAVSRFPACHRRFNRKRPMSPPAMHESWRRGRDSNPRYPFGVHTISSRAPSTARPPLPIGILRTYAPCPAASTANVSKMSPRSFLGRFAELLFSEVNTSFHGSKDRMRETGF